MIRIKKSLRYILLVLTANYANSSLANTKEVNLTCEKLFQESEHIIAEADKQPGTHLQVEQIKQQIIQAKKEILSIDKTTQEKTCELGISKLEELKQQ